jgi:hypothetical protein
MIQKIISIFLSLSLAVPVLASPKEENQIDFIFRELLKKHESFLENFLEEAHVSNFEKAFYTDMGFSRNLQTISFFENLKTNLDNGNAPRLPGYTQISYTSYSNINGVTSAISYDYRLDGKNIILTKGTLKNGEMLKAVYQYNMEGKQLDTKEFQGKKLLSNKTYKYEI